MRALTLTQPWCGLVASGIKLVENRPRRMIKREDFGRRFALHASREVDDSVVPRLREIAPEIFGNDMDMTDEEFLEFMPSWMKLGAIRSAVIAVAILDGEVVDRFDRLRVRHSVERMTELADDQRRWFFGPIGYVLRDVRALAAPVPCRGWQGFWTLPADVDALVAEQLGDPR